MSTRCRHVAFGGTALGRGFDDTGEGSAELGRHIIWPPRDHRRQGYSDSLVCQESPSEFVHELFKRIVGATGQPSYRQSALAFLLYGPSLIFEYGLSFRWPIGRHCICTHRPLVLWVTAIVVTRAVSSPIPGGDRDWRRSFESEALEGTLALDGNMGVSSQAANLPSAPLCR